MLLKDIKPHTIRIELDPKVWTNCGNNAYFIDDGMGHLIPVNDHLGLGDIKYNTGCLKMYLMKYNNYERHEFSYILNNGYYVRTHASIYDDYFASDIELNVQDSRGDIVFQKNFREPYDYEIFRRAYNVYEKFEFTEEELEAVSFIEELVHD